MKEKISPNTIANAKLNVSWYRAEIEIFIFIFHLSVASTWLLSSESHLLT